MPIYLHVIMLAERKDEIILSLATQCNINLPGLREILYFIRSLTRTEAITELL